jgi:hypothetical protein
MTRWEFNDGGRKAAGFKGTAGDCVTRAIAIAADLPYRTVYDALKVNVDLWRTTSRSKRAKASVARGSREVREGTPPEAYKPYLAELGFTWTPTMSIGTGTTVHLTAGELPLGRLVVRCSGHLCAVIDGVIHDIGDPSRGGTRAVYGYWTAP